MPRLEQCGNVGAVSEHGAVTHQTPEERAAAGLAARDRLPREQLADLVITPDRPSVVEVLQSQASSRVPELIPIRHARMSVSPFTFFRGAALSMAHDIAASDTRAPRPALR